MWIYLLILGLIIFSSWNITISSDMGWYMNAALNIFLGNGYTDIDGSLIFERGPIFSLMVAASYWLFGVSPWSAFCVVRIFAILNPILVYFLGKKLFGKWVGFSAALLILSSYSMNYWSYRHLDAVWPSFVLLTIISIWSAFEKRNYIYFVFSAFFIGLSYLVKEAPILLFPVPFLVWAIVKDYRNGKNLKGSLIYILFVSIIISPWMYYLYFHTHNMKLAILGMGGEIAADATLNPDLFLFFKNYALGLWDYYGSGSQSLSSNFSLAPLFVCAWIFTVYRAIRGEKSSILLAILLLLLSPYISHVGRHDLRVGQLIIFLLLSYLVTARFCIEMAVKISMHLKDTIHYKNHHLSFLPLVIISLLIFIQTFISHRGDKRNIEFIRNSHFFRKLITKEKVDKWEFVKKAEKECAIWMSNNITENARIAVAKGDSGKHFYFDTCGKYPIYYMPIIQSNKLKNCGTYSGNGKLIFLTSQLSRNVPTNKILLLTEEDLLSFIDEMDIEYIVLGLGRNYLAIYFNDNDSFIKIREFGNGSYKIYRVLAPKPKKNNKPIISNKLVTFLKTLQIKEPTMIDWYVSKFFRPVLGWEKKDVNKIIQLGEHNNEFQLVYNLRIY